jgi:hypothetical protein
MATAEDVERTLEAARFAVLKARACFWEWCAPPPERECTLPEEEYVKRIRVEDAAAASEHALWEALGIIRHEFLGRVPIEDTGDVDEQ